MLVAQGCSNRGSLMPSAPAPRVSPAAVLGTFFQVGGGPPPGVLPDALNDLAAWTPTGLRVDAIRNPWTGGRFDGTALTGLALLGGACFALASWRLARD